MRNAGPHSGVPFNLFSQVPQEPFDGVVVKKGGAECRIGSFAAVHIETITIALCEEEVVVVC